MVTRKLTTILTLAFSSITFPAWAQQTYNVLSGTALGSNLALGIDTLPSHKTNWLTPEQATASTPADLKMVCPAGEASCFMFITDGPALSGYPRPGLDMSGYSSISVVIEGDNNTTVQIGLKDSNAPDNGTEIKATLNVSSNWTTQTIPLTRFTGTNLKSTYVLCEFVFPGGSQAQTLRVQSIYFNPPSPATTYYFPHLAIGGGWQTTFTYLNYSVQSVTCQTSYFGDSGAALSVPFAAGAVSTRSDTLAPGTTLHVQTTADVNGQTTEGWAETQCSGPIKASLLYRFYSGAAAQGEAGVNASTAPATVFVTFAETHTGVAVANPSASSAQVTFTVLDTSGNTLGTNTVTLAPNAHTSFNVGGFLQIGSFNGSLQITSPVPVVSLSINAEAFPVFSSLPPGDLPDGTPLQ